MKANLVLCVFCSALLLMGAAFLFYAVLIEMSAAAIVIGLTLYVVAALPFVFIELSKQVEGVSRFLKGTIRFVLVCLHVMIRKY